MSEGGVALVRCQVCALAPDFVLHFHVFQPSFRRKPGSITVRPHYAGPSKSATKPSISPATRPRCVPAAPAAPLQRRRACARFYGNAQRLSRARWHRQQRRLPDSCATHPSDFPARTPYPQPMTLDLPPQTPSVSSVKSVDQAPALIDGSVPNLDGRSIKETYRRAAQKVGFSLPTIKAQEGNATFYRFSDSNGNAENRRKCAFFVDSGLRRNDGMATRAGHRWPPGPTGSLDCARDDRVGGAWDAPISGFRPCRSVERSPERRHSRCHRCF